MVFERDLLMVKKKGLHLASLLAGQRVGWKASERDEKKGKQ